MQQGQFGIELILYLLAFFNFPLFSEFFSSVLMIFSSVLMNMQIR